GVGERRERIAQLVRERREEPVLLPIFLLETLGALLERLLHLLDVGPIAQDLAEADERSGGRAQRHDDAEREKASAVLALVPPLVLGAAGVARHLQLARRRALGDLLAREQNVERP